MNDGASFSLEVGTKISWAKKQSKKNEAARENKTSIAGDIRAPSSELSVGKIQAVG